MDREVDGCIHDVGVTSIRSDELQNVVGENKHQGSFVGGEPLEYCLISVC